MKKVALICAIPQETRPILRQLGYLARVKSADMPFWQGISANQHVILAESGIGISRARAAAEKIIKSDSPDIIISTGFCGAVKPGLRRGDIVVATRILSYTSTLQPLALTIDNNIRTLLNSPGKICFHMGTFITTEKMLAKRLIASLLNEQPPNPVLEMESHAIAEICHCSNIPFAAIRAVSDTAEYDPESICSKIFDPWMKLSIMRLLLAVTTSPMRVQELLRLYVDTAAAGKSLAQAIALTIERLR